MQRMWEWFQGRAHTTHAKVWLFILSFTESSFFIIPPDVLLMAMLSARAGRWVYLASLTAIASLLGAVAGYLLGAFVFEPIAQPIIQFYHLTEQFAHVGTLYEQNAFWVVLTAAFTPIPFKVFVLSAGFFGVPFIPFIVASAIGRSARFFIVAWISHRFGPPVAEMFLRNFRYVTIATVVVLTIGALWYFDVPGLPF